MCTYAKAVLAPTHGSMLRMRMHTEAASSAIGVLPISEMTRAAVCGRVHPARRATPLHKAAANGHAAMANALLTHGADVNAKDNSGCGGRSLFWATVVDQAGIDAPRSGCPHTDTCTHACTHGNGRSSMWDHAYECVLTRAHAHTSAHLHAGSRALRACTHTRAHTLS